MILVVRRETHPVAAEDAGAVVYDSVAGVSAVGGHVDAVLGVRLVADRERQVLGQVPASRRLLLYLNPQSARPQMRISDYSRQRNINNNEEEEEEEDKDKEEQKNKKKRRREKELEEEQRG